MRLTRSVFGYFKRYVENEIANTKGKSVYKNILGWRRIEFDKRPWLYTEDRPWTDAAKKANLPSELNKRRKVWVEPIKEWTIYKGDRVEILKGHDKGKQGIVCQIIKERNWCYVEGLNCKYDTMNKSAINPGTIVRVEQPLLVTTEISLVDPSDEKSTAVQWRYTEEGERVRVSTRTGRIIPLSRDARYADPEDGINTLDFKETNKDTTEAVLTKITFEAKLKTFEQDLMDEYGIKEDRQRALTYYY